MQERMDAIDAETATSMDRNDPMYGRERTATLTPRLPQMIPAPVEDSPEESVQLPEPGETRGKLSPEETAMGRAMLEAIRDSGFGQPEEQQPPSIDTPASEVIEPTEEVKEKVNKPLGDDMKNISFKKPNQNLANVVKPLMKPSLYEAVGGQHDDLTPEQRRAIVSALERKKVKPTFTEQPKPPTDREERIQELKDKEAEQPQRMAPKGGKGGQDVKPSDEKPKGGKMSMKDLVNNSTASKNAKKTNPPLMPIKGVPTIHGSTEPDVVRQVMDMVEEGNEKAFSMLYGSMGDLAEIDHPANHLFDEAEDLIEEYQKRQSERNDKAAAKAKRAERRKKESKSRKKEQSKDPSRNKDISAPLTEATEGNDNEAIARRLLGNRD